MYNPKTGDGRITGSAASLLWLEKALQESNDAKVNMAIAKIIMLHAIVMSYVGIPLIYAGDELGTLNDYSYLNDAHKKDDSRWVNRPRQDWRIVCGLDRKKTHYATIFSALQTLIRVRKKNIAFADQNNLVLYGNPSPYVFVYERSSEKDEGVLLICNFDELSQRVYTIALGAFGKKGNMKDLITGVRVAFTENKLVLLPYQIFWLQK